MELKSFGEIIDKSFDAILQDEESDLIGATEVAEILDIKLDRVRYLSRLNRIPSRTLGKMGTRIYSKKQIEKIKESNIQL
tara:strand:+ start:48 stop:287 length:240 start_codon:yes stop_codon:yes gene_type:complete